MRRHIIFHSQHLLYPNYMEAPSLQSQIPVITHRPPKLSVLVMLGLVAAVIAFVVGYFVFTKPNAGPASLIFDKLFPSQSGLVQLQSADLDIESIVTNSVFSQLKEYGPIPLQIPPLGKPNPFI